MPSANQLAVRATVRAGRPVLYKTIVQLICATIEKRERGEQLTETDLIGERRGSGKATRYFIEEAEAERWLDVVYPAAPTDQNVDAYHGGHVDRLAANLGRAGIVQQLEAEANPETSSAGAMCANELKLRSQSAHPIQVSEHSRSAFALDDACVRIEAAAARTQRLVAVVIALLIFGAAAWFNAELAASDFDAAVEILIPAALTALILVAVTRISWAISIGKLTSRLAVASLAPVLGASFSAAAFKFVQVVAA